MAQTGQVAKHLSVWLNAFASSLRINLPRTANRHPPHCSSGVKALTASAEKKIEIQKLYQK